MTNPVSVIAAPHDFTIPGTDKVVANGVVVHKLEASRITRRSLLT
jgi:hypothetical protein